MSDAVLVEAYLAGRPPTPCPARCCEGVEDNVHRPRVTMLGCEVVEHAGRSDDVLRILARAKISMALMLLTQRNSGADINTERHHARTWLLRSDGDLPFWCEHAGLKVELVRKRAREICGAPPLRNDSDLRVSIAVLKKKKYKHE